MSPFERKPFWRLSTSFCTFAFCRSGFLQLYCFDDRNQKSCWHRKNAGAVGETWLKKDSRWIERIRGFLSHYYCFLRVLKRKMDRKISVCVRELSDCWSLHYHGFNLEMALVQSGFRNESLRTLMVSATLNGRAGCRSHHQLLAKGLKDIEGTQVGNVEPIFEFFSKFPPIKISSRRLFDGYLRALRPIIPRAPTVAKSSTSVTWSLMSLHSLNIAQLSDFLYVLVSCCVMFGFHIFRLAVTGMVTLSL